MKQSRICVVLDVVEFVLTAFCYTLLSRLGSPNSQQFSAACSTMLRILLQTAVMPQ